MQRSTTLESAKAMHSTLIQRPKTGSPLLMLSSEKDGCRCNSVYNPEDGRVYEPKSDFSGYRFLGSSGKWFLVVDSRMKLYIIDVFSEKRIELPPLESFKGSLFKILRDGEENVKHMQMADNDPFRDEFPHAAEYLRGRLWVEDKNGNYVVVWQFEKNQFLGFCRTGDDHYREIPTQLEVQRELRGLYDMVLKGYNLYVFATREFIRHLDLSGQDEDGFKDVSEKHRLPMWMPRLTMKEHCLARSCLSGNPTPTVSPPARWLRVNATSFMNGVTEPAASASKLTDPYLLRQARKAADELLAGRTTSQKNCRRTVVVGSGTNCLSQSWVQYTSFRADRLGTRLFGITGFLSIETKADKKLYLAEAKLGTSVYDNWVLVSEAVDSRSGFALNIGICSAPLAELWGVYYGLYIAWEYKVTRLELEVDSEIVVGFLKTGISDTHPLSFLARLCYGFISRDWIVRISHKYREANRLADGLANYAFSLPPGFHGLGACPESVLAVFGDDVNGVGTSRNVLLLFGSVLLVGESDPNKRESRNQLKCIPSNKGIAVTRAGQVLLVYTFDLGTSASHRMFRLYKRDPKDLDPKTLDTWLLEVHSLGDEALFLDLGITVPADHTLGIEPNSIYFTRGDRIRHKESSCLDICVFNLITKTIKRFHGLSNFNFYDAQWFLPS
ncbi:Ribonuclease H domain [Arabidopsis thaliana x Arabidopsis arenosa]|uniref:Ribonuclease H domain n=1 Tax=Arabidopsis thaliana x Arabidopsis arenosa TaxID=1240361 RepID=A0A8T2GKD3_9BRAS|nr:Ribonuclease H domain [Arabidopsis thaliana x Arabidopsis arenosa]